MAIADDLLGLTLTGRGKEPREWYVHEKVSSSQGQTPGFFSVSYKCRDKNGYEAFLKASDISKVLSSNPNDMMTVLSDAIQAHRFERDVLDLCKGNSMDRVVTALDYGNENINHNGVSEFLFFLVFELAEGDLRNRITQRQSVDLIWTVTALHEYAVAVSQLHNGTIYHNDIKPANALVFPEGGNKIADLGRATTPLLPSAHEAYQCAGDQRFAPPEQLYALDQPIARTDMFDFQRAGDLYNLGSLCNYLLTGVSISQEIVRRLRIEHRPPFMNGGWRDKLSMIIPYWHSHLAEIVQETKSQLLENNSSTYSKEILFITGMISELCNPNWKDRGFRSTDKNSNKYDLARYISRLDLSRNRLMIGQKHAK